MANQDTRNPLIVQCAGVSKINILTNKSYERISLVFSTNIYVNEQGAQPQYFGKV